MTSNKSLYTFFGGVTVGFQRGLIVAYFLLTAFALYCVDWHYFSWLSFILALYAGLWAADFISGLIHLYIDYRPLNYARGIDRLYDYQGDRGSREFIEMKAEIMQHANWFDHVVYAFKIHHRNASSNRDKPYRDFFTEFVALASILLLCSLFVSWIFPASPWSAYLAFFDVIVSMAALHADHIHVCAHGSTSMPWGTKAVKWLQKYHLIYSYQTHALHHKDGKSGFCFVTGHANFAVDWICRRLLTFGLIHGDDWFGLPRDQGRMKAA